MKKLLTLAAIFALVFVACKTEPDYGEIGKKGPGGGTIFFAEGNQYMECSGELGDDIWDRAITTAKNYQGGGFSNWHLPARNELDLMYKNLKKNGLGGLSKAYYWTSVDDSTTTSTSYSAYYQNFSNGYQGYQEKRYSCHVRAVRAYTKDTDTNSISFKIKNESSKTISDVLWNNVSFKRDSSNANIISGTNVTKSVEAGSGYVFFKVGTTAYRTKDLVVVEKDNEAEFTFNNYTLVVNVISPDNTVTLGSL